MQYKQLPLFTGEVVIQEWFDSVWLIFEWRDYEGRIINDYIVERLGLK